MNDQEVTASRHGVANVQGVDDTVYAISAFESTGISLSAKRSVVR